MSEYYDGTKLLSMKDINGNTPELFLCTSNRSAGKTTYFSRMLVNRFLKKQKKFILLYRFTYELRDIPEKFFKDIQGLFFPDKAMTVKMKASGTFAELYLDDNSCGYGIALNTADKIKTYSHYFSDADSIMFDEFQSETNHYCSDEIKKFISVHTSVSRGQGKMSRYVPVYMLSNAVTLLNPYFTALNISGRLKKNTKFLRGNGFVLESNLNEFARAAQSQSLFNQAFASNSYVEYAAQNIYLNDNYAFIEKPSGKNKYIATIRFMGTDYGIREYTENGYLYVNKNPDMSNKNRIAVTTEDHNVNYVMIKNYDFMISIFRDYFNKGAFRFYDLDCKNALLQTISY